MKKILFIEDDENWQTNYKDIFEDTATILQATTLKDAEELFLKHPDVDIIVVDGCLNENDVLDTLPLIKKIRETYKGPMIAASGHEEFRHKMVLAGCNKQREKYDVIDLIREMLDN